MKKLYVCEKVAIDFKTFNFFWKYEGKVKMMSLNQKQIIELKKFIPDLTKEKIKDYFKKIESVKK